MVEYLKFDVFAMSDPKTIEDCLAVVLEVTQMMEELYEQLVVLEAQLASLR